MKIICVIPARYASTRLPGKPLADIAGKPMIVRVYERVLNATKPAEVIAAYLQMKGWGNGSCLN